MTSSPRPCDAFEATVAEWLDGTLAPEARAAADAHVGGCARCAALVADLERIMTDARALPELVPSRDLWPGIAERIAPPVLALPTGGAVAPARPAAWRRWAAAAALVVVSAGSTWWLMRPGVPGGDTRSGGATVAERPGQPRTPKPVVVSRPSPVETLSDEVQRLQQALAARERELDPKTVAVIEQSLAIIDRAIADAQAALAADPSNALLDQQLTRVLGRKVELMRRAAMLPAQT